MLKGKQKRQLRALAHNLTPIFQVGKSGVTVRWFKVFEMHWKNVNC